MSRILKYEEQIMWISGFFLVIGLVLYYTGTILSLANALLIGVSVLAGIPVLIKAVNALRYKTFSIDLLVAVSVIGALLIGEYVESSVVPFIFLFGSYLEKRTLDRTRRSITSLYEMAPDTAVRLESDGTEHLIDIEEINVGDQLIVKQGGKIPVDGRIIKGSGSVNQASMTGESVPVTKSEQDSVLSGTTLEDGYLLIEAETESDNSTFSKMIELVDEAQDSSTKAERFLTRFSQYYTPLVLLFALAAYFITRNAHLAITFVVVACPGGLVIGAPASTISGIGNGAKNGILMKGGEVVERLNKIDTLVFDKTGTLTQGQPSVVAHSNLSTLTDGEWFAVLADLERVSEHHLGRAIREHHLESDTENLTINVTEKEAIKARGVKGLYKGEPLLIGNQALLQEHGIEVTTGEEITQQQQEGATVVYVGFAGAYQGWVAIADPIRPEAKQAIETFKAQGIDRIIMLTGDNEIVAQSVAERIGITEVYANLLPEDKLNYIKELQEQGRKVAMAGDGVNDAPAIALADIGLAMGQSGVDVSMEIADMVLMADNLKQYNHAYGLAKKTIANLHQNIAISLIAVFGLLYGVLTGNVNMAVGMILHHISMLAVVVNAMRLMPYKPNFKIVK